MRRMAFLILLVLWSWPGHAGILASSTRVIFHEGETQKSLMLSNVNAWPVVVQTWVDDGDINQAPGSVKTPYVAVPALFRLEPKGVQGLRLIHNQTPLPADRESVFWLNIYEIPPTGSAVPSPQSMVLTMNTQMKIFWRPAALNNPEQALKAITFRRDGMALMCHNASPYYVSFAGIRVDAGEKSYPTEQLPDMMIAPRSEKRYPLLPGTPLAARVQATIVDDNGNSEVYSFPVR